MDALNRKRRYGIRDQPMHNLTSPKPKLDGERAKRMNCRWPWADFGLFTHSPSLRARSKDEGRTGAKKGVGRGGLTSSTATAARLSPGPTFDPFFAVRWRTGLKMSEKHTT